MAGRDGSFEQVELHPEGQVVGRRRCQQPHQHPPYPQHAFPVPRSSFRTGTQAAAAAAAKLFPSGAAAAAAAAGHRSRVGSLAEDQLPPWRRRRLFMEPPEPASEKPRAHRALWKAPSGRQWPVLVACLTCCTLLGWYTASSLKDSEMTLQGLWEKDEDPETTTMEMMMETEKEVTVLVWWRPFGHGAISGGCWQFNISACLVSTNHTLQPKADAVVIHHRDLQFHGLGQLPRERPADQRWVWMNLESPTHTWGLRNLNGLFNWTMSYREDSDIFTPYGYLKLRPEPLVQLTLPKKTKLVAWAISNWKEGHARVRYYRQLKKYLSIDVYGSHGLSLKANDVVKTVSEYKFYLAFENSQHQDYITEKLWRNALASWAVPIVLGPPRANYERFIPSDAFIHVNDFSDPMELAVYLKFLDKNENMYQKHFAWRKQYDVRTLSYWTEHCCRVCNAIRKVGKQPKTIQNLTTWFQS